MERFLQAVCLCVAIEGLLFALAPNLARRAMEEISSRSNHELRMLGAVGLASAALLAWLLR